MVFSFMFILSVMPRIMGAAEYYLKAGLLTKC